LEQKAEVFYILPGNTHASGPSCILPSPKRYMRPKLQAGYAEYEEATEYLEPESLNIPRSIPPNDLAGPRYRKIGLNGAPMPDSTPGQQNDESALPEETYVDAYNRQLRHSTSDVWAKSSSTDVPIQVRRDYSPDVWSWRSGLRPDERPDRPFGPGWTSNLTPHIRLELNSNTTDQWIEWFYHVYKIQGQYLIKSDSLEPDHWEQRGYDKLRNPPRITLMDERGASCSFTDLGLEWDFSNSNPVERGFKAKWVGSPDERQDSKTAFDTLEQQPPGLAKNAQSFILTKRNGTKCYYSRCDLVQSFPQDRVRPTGQKSDNYYYRLDYVETAQGNRVVYSYDYDNNPGTADVPSLIPASISDPDRPECKLIITQDKGRVVSIEGPSEEVAHYHYSAPQDGFELEDLQTPRTSFGANATDMYPVLTSVTREDGQTVLQEVKYEYSYAFETDPTPDATQPGVQTYGHLELAKITDERGNAFSFQYEINQFTQYEGWNGIFNFTRKQVGLPRLLTQIQRPDHTPQQPSLITFAGTRNVLLKYDKSVTGGMQTVVNGACGNYTYTFYAPHVSRPRELTNFFNGWQANYPDGDINEGIVYLSFTKMDITSRPSGGGSVAGVETYEFQPDAGMALKKITDMSGNMTTYVYDDPVVLPPGEFNSLGVQFYDDPKVETSALNGEPRGNLSAFGYGGNHVGQKKYTYHPTFRTRTSMTDERGIKTGTVLDPVTGLPSEESVSFDPNNTPTNSADDVVLRRTTSSYTHPTEPNNPDYVKFKAFLYRQTVTIDGFSLPPGYQAPPGSPGPALEMVTDYLPDANGRVWKEIRYSGPNQTLPLTTTTTYTSGGQKQTVTDPLGNVTTFTYEGQTLRLSGTIFPGPGPVLPFKQLFYDTHGNIIKELDETGNAALHEYDVFNRRTKTAVDLNNNGLIDLSYTTVTLPAADNPAPVSYDGDIVTSTTYNAFNLPVDVTDPRGVVTHHDYDAIGRLIRTTVDAANPDATRRQITRFTNENASITDDFVGGSVFDTKGFKPLQVTDPRGMVTTFEYDKAYHVLSKRLTDTTYTPARQVIVRTYYDDAGNAVYQQDPLYRITQTLYDGLNRPVEVHHPQDANTPAAFTQTFYTPAGLVWRTLDEEGAESLAFHDYAGRKTHIYAPAVPVFDPITQQTVMQRPLTITDYDAAGNPTHVHDPLGRVTETQYDMRNRPRFVIAPAVLNVVSPTVAPVMVQPLMEKRYDAAGRVITVIDPLGVETHTHYDRAGRAYRVIAPQTGAQTHITRNKMDPGGNILQVIDAKEQVVTNVYDAFSRLEQTTDHNQITNLFGYDKAGNRISVKDGLNQETVFTYDAQNRLRTQVFANTDTTTVNYNNVQKTSELKPDGITLTFGYDARDRLRTSTDSSDSYISRIYTYDKTGRLKAVTQGGQLSVSLTYNAQGWLTSETSSGLLHSYGYDLVGSRIHAAYGTGRSVATTYDDLNRPLTITEGGRTTSYGYDLAGRAVSLLTGNGNFCWNVHDVLGRLKKRTLYADATAQVELTELDWDYDALGNVLSHLENWPGSPLRSQGWRVTTMTYDGSNRLHTEIVSHSELQLIHTTYTYDAAHNRQTKTVLGGDKPGFWDYNYNVANQLRTWQKHDEEGGELLTNALLNYDANGNRTSQTVSDVAEFIPDTVYLWTAENRLNTCYQDGGDNIFHTYSYDYRCRRVTTYARTGSQPIDYSKISFSGGLSVAEWESTGTQPVVTAPPTVEYTRGPDMGGGVGGLLYSMRGTTPKFNLSNGRGDIVAQSGSNGALTWTASYEAYGKRTKETGTNQDKQRANSKEEDNLFGLLNEGFRYRDIETGVWLSRDPAGFVDGPNLYAYVMQNPWSKFDPLGLAAGEPYQTFDAALVSASTDVWSYQPSKGERSPKEVEYGSSIYKTAEGKYSYTKPYGDGKPAAVNARKAGLPKDASFEGFTHNHPESHPGGNTSMVRQMFSRRGNATGGGDGDQEWANKEGKPIGLVTTNPYDPNQVIIKKYSPTKGAKEQQQETGVVTEYNANSGTFGPEKTIGRPPLTAPEWVGTSKGMNRYKMPDGSYQEVKKGEPAPTVTPKPEVKKTDSESKPK
jgi:RHS repeat-associated protein